MKMERNEILETSETTGVIKWGKIKKNLIPAVLFLGLVSVSGYLTVNAGKSDNCIVINEVMSSNSQSVNSLGSPDWIELYNDTQTDADISGYEIRGSNGSYTFKGTTIKAGEYLLVYASKSILKEEGCCCAGFGIQASGDVICLIDKKGEVISQLSIPSLVADESYARRDNGTYGYCINATPGALNDSAGIMSAVDLQNKLRGSKLIISEVMPTGKPSWLELYNAGDIPADLEVYCLTDSKNAPSKWHMPKGSINPGGYMVVYMSDSSESDGLAAPFSFGSVDMCAYLYDVSGTLRSSIKWEKDIIRGVSVVADDTYTAYPTLGKANSTDTFSSAVQAPMTGNDSVRINEVLPTNKYGIADNDGNRWGWAELYNSGSGPVSLKNYFLSDDNENLLKWELPDKDIPAGGYITVFLSGEKDKQADFHASFNLSEGEKDVYLTSISGMRVDTFTLPGDLPEDVSLGRDSSGETVYYTMPTPGAANSTEQKIKPKILRPNKNGVYISEVSAASQAKSGANDWIELHNGSNADVNLEGYYLSDDPKSIQKWKIGALSIDTGGYAVIEASSVSSSTGMADFGISPSGETLLLSDPNGIVIDAFDTGVLSPGMASGRIETGDSAQRVFFTVPTKGTANSTQPQTGYTSEPEFSEAGLYHKEAFQLSITCTTSGAKIYFTTDGSDPTQNSNLYTAPFLINRNLPVRAIAYADGMVPSKVKTSTFLFDAHYTLPVFCLTGKPADFKELMNATYKKVYYNKNEYLANVEYYEKDGTLCVSFESGLRPKGRASLGDPQKSFTMALRNSYGQKEVTYPFFDRAKINTFTTLSLRNGGQDYDKARLRDSYFQKVAAGMNVDTTNTSMVIVYMNGMYCGLYDLDEEQNPDYLAAYYGVKKDSIDIIDRTGAALHGDNKEFLRVMSMADTSDLSNDAAYAELQKYIDVDSFTDYLAFQIYFGNGDPSNTRYWRAQDYSVKWRLMLHDLDWGLKDNDVNADVFGVYFNLCYVYRKNGMVTNTSIFHALKQNKSWGDKFVNRVVQLAETQLSPDRILPIFDSMTGEMLAEMPKHIGRFGTPHSMEVWKNQTGELRSALAQRREVVFKQLQKYFGVSDAYLQELISRYSAGSTGSTANAAK